VRRISREVLRSGPHSGIAASEDLAPAAPSSARLPELDEAGTPVHAVGNAGALFAGVGIDHVHLRPPGGPPDDLRGRPSPEGA
jgi:hypothetical protein